MLELLRLVCALGLGVLCMALWIAFFERIQQEAIEEHERRKNPPPPVPAAPRPDPVRDILEYVRTHPPDWSTTKGD